MKRTNLRTRRVRPRPQAAALALLLACSGQPAIDPVQPNATSGLTPMVRELVDAKVRAVESAPGKAGAHASLGLVYEANEMFEEASRCYANAIALAPDEPRWRYRRAIMLRETGQFDAGIELMLEAAKEMRDVPAVHQRLGYDLLDVGRSEEALRSFERVVQLVGQRAEGHLGVGEVFVRDGRYTEALPHLLKALTIDARLQSAHYALGLAYRGMGRLDEAERELGLGLNARRIFLADASSATLASFTRGYKGILVSAGNLMAAGELARAARLLEDLVEAYPDDAVALNNLAAAYLALEEYDKALELLTRSIATDQKQVGAFINASKVHRALGDPSAALRMANRAIALSPGVAATHRAKADAQLVLNDLVGAHASLQTALENDATNFETCMMFGETSFRMSLYGDAERAFEKSVELRPEFLPARVNLAMVLVRMERYEEADLALQEAEKLAPQHEKVVALRRDLNERRR